MSTKNVFSSNLDINKTAYLNWRMDEDSEGNLAEMANGFYLSARVQIDAILEDNSDKKADSIIFPILYAIDQSIELYLKAIIRLIERIEDGKANNYTTHDIAELLGNLKGKIKRKEATTKGLQKHLSSVQLYVDELTAHFSGDDKKVKMDFARYPMDAKGIPYCYVKSRENVTVDVEYLHQQLEDMHTALEALYLQYSVELDWVIQRRYEHSIW